MIKYILLFLLLTNCSEFLLLSSGAGTIASQNVYVKAYNGVDMLTIINTNKDIKKHAYNKIKGKND
tara:strand:+ start:131 stop:328 length:198 start_codon:yes stop_codon:yes gene_type:complete